MWNYLTKPYSLCSTCPALRGYRLPPKEILMKNNKVRRNTTPIKVWVFQDEKEEIVKNARNHGLSTSAFLRNLGLNIEVQGTMDQQAILELVKVNADLGRLGGLLKLWLTNDERTKNFNKGTIDELLNRISVIQNEMYEKVTKI